MRFVAGLLFACLCSAESLEVRKLALTRLASEADSFELSAHRFIGMERLKQTIPAGIRVSRRGIETKVPEHTREIVSRYGYVPVDERGGSLRESRSILTIDGLRWNKKKGLDGLAKSITARTDQQRRKLIEDFESHGLEGVITDVSQVILLFARGRTSQYEFTHEATEKDPTGEEILVYRFQQIDGPQSFRIYEGKQTMGDKIRGKLWARARDGEPLRIGLETNRQVKASKIRDTVVVSYYKGLFGLPLPVRVLHEQYENGELSVQNDFLYSDFEEVLPGPKAR